MQYDHILVRYGEMSLKGKNRKHFINHLKNNIKLALSSFSSLEYTANRDRLFIKLNGEDGEKVAEKLQTVFGIQSFSLAIRTKSDIEAIKDTALQAVKQLYKNGDTFKVSAKRADKSFPLTSDQLNYEIGRHILIHTDGLKVDVHHPDINVRVEVRPHATYIMCKDFKGAGGLPVGSSGKAMLMLSGGIDSPVAGYLSMKRGLEIEAIHFFSPPYTNERAKQKVMDLVEKLTEFGGKIVLHIVPFTEIQVTIQQKILENYTMTSTRRMMLKIADEIRKNRGALAIVTGESLGQVASQTLESMYAINEVTTTPILRPLISMDKNEIIEIAEKIDTFEISNRPYEDCCTIFTPASPKTKPKREKILKLESYVDFQPLIQKAIEETVTIEFPRKHDIQEKIEEDFENLL
ncbi:MAG: tRNA 4-thiouridine(8) synthase ThiI [Bacillaceae bacterium]|jgi:tRNA uracil 4-sulfurtransferase|uniref:Probable tRNA sulfurtransferase n=1 Tax=Aeribacillus composti TaxID=1868734 RepID=A0ABY9WA56_9BACI|nr:MULTISPECIES: tRNA uracil 4-sulfurtransferase ThiI [Aeribacillus]REJ20764.1 MAG: tRNA 4-thiouridine(8) synthase ThiI [Bacillaceae bacterium]KZM56549.1 tRNA sulfurtransferase ThiI [Aeribacillus pallidus]MDR9791665.1 tRNA uracil 4-sulfurtransferase ThiI [Aeribacillus pallidus]MED0651179.1 tRNA 4-thiouridine(8) synthase ThiI [Aeribacillus composti]MED0703403.1 tRNA 4-thiouridine(8) synthase ThiI [Aeribacillus composti]